LAAAAILAWESGQIWLRRALQTAPWLERRWRMLMRLYARQGRRALALKAYQETLTSGYKRQQNAARSWRSN
jgi:DNA-binding SARP family transcriptional activator